ncbi:MAG: hypothetical protein LBR81_00575 [Prevotellaceae bacterium]|jgi:hypothetical protein|nr:hypothetical protein [Prevotellaceae bacterium]
MIKIIGETVGNISRLLDTAIFGKIYFVGIDNSNMAKRTIAIEFRLCNMLQANGTINVLVVAFSRVVMQQRMNYRCYRQIEQIKAQ